jgi:hypothetical protein
MDEQGSRPGRGDAEFLLRQLGNGVQIVFKAIFFILCGAIVVIWESFGKAFQTVYEKGSEYGADLLSVSAPKPAPQKVKVRVLPIDNYSHLSVDELLSRLETLSAEELAMIKSLEMAQQNRSVILEAIEKKLGEAR